MEDIAGDMVWIDTNDADATINIWLEDKDLPLYKKDQQITIHAGHNRNLPLECWDQEVLQFFTNMTDMTMLLFPPDLATQLALANYWFHPHENCESGTRLKHSLGVLRVADAWFSFLSGKPSAQDDPIIERRKHIRLAALLHDVGHTPFSHLTERVFNELHWTLSGLNGRFSHEEMTKLCITKLNHVPGTPAKPIIADVGKIFDLIDGTSGVAWESAIINSPIDADKIDYLFRDSSGLRFAARLGKPYEFLSDFFSGQTISTTNQIVLRGTSAEAAYKLLVERCQQRKSRSCWKK